MVLFSDMLAQILVERVLLDSEDSKAAVKKEKNEIENESFEDEDGASVTCDGNTQQIDRSNIQSQHQSEKMAKVQMYRIYNCRCQLSQICHDIEGQVRGVLEGESVATSKDGNTIIIGDLRVPCSDSLTNGIVWVFVYPKDTLFHFLEMGPRSQLGIIYWSTFKYFILFKDQRLIHLMLMAIVIKVMMT